MVRKLILLCATVIPMCTPTLLAKPKAHTPGKPSKYTMGKPSKYNPKPHSKPLKQKQQFRVRHGRIKH
ncbi:MAG TPA: hypothetical protein VEU96_04580 [Bryobacteraceae bacterium]|nr:hypothetical protein [Bryobacteraceae bacterium]